MKRIKYQNHSDCFFFHPQLYAFLMYKRNGAHSISNQTLEYFYSIQQCRYQHFTINKLYHSVKEECQWKVSLNNIQCSTLHKTSGPTIFHTDNAWSSLLYAIAPISDNLMYARFIRQKGRCKLKMEQRYVLVHF